MKNTRTIILEEFFLVKLITRSLKPKVYLERCQTSKMEHFANRLLFLQKAPS